MSEELFETIRKQYITSQPEDCVYLDHAGSTIPRRDMIEQIMRELLDSSSVLSNPHTSSISGRFTDERITSTRLMVKEFLCASDYDVIFTANATMAIKLVGESFPWTNDSVLCYPINSHTSLLGIRSYSENAVCLSINDLPRSSLNERLDRSDNETDSIDNHQSNTYNLLLVPGECNFTGEKVDLTMIGDLTIDHDRMNRLCRDAHIVKGKLPDESIKSNWLWFLDASKLAATSQISIDTLESHHRPHFISLSFYKIFGYPTGIGALLVRKDIKHLLHKTYHGGGTVAAISAYDDYLTGRSLDDLGRLFEDGTPNYHGIAALKYGFQSIKEMGGMIAIQHHTYTLAKYLADRLMDLKHDQSSNLQVAKVYGRYNSSLECSLNTQGPVISFNLYWNDGNPIGFSHISQLAESNHIILRTGCFCNPGGCQELLNISTEEIIYHHSEGRVCGSESGDIINGKVTGSIRVSLGFSSIRSDCDKFIDFIKKYFQNQSDRNLATFESVSINSLTINKIQSTINIKQSQSHSLVKNIVLDSIYVYPIKSCGGFQVMKYWKVTSNGLYLDRNWAVIDANTNRVLTQKNYTRLSQVQVKPDLRRNILVVSHPRMTDVLELAIPNHNDVDDETINGDVRGYDCTQSSTLNVRLCGRQQSARSVLMNRTGSNHMTSLTKGSDSILADDWFTKLIDSGLRCKLVIANDYSSSENKSSFVNEAQLLLISQESVSALNDAIAELYSIPSESQSPSAVTAENFRPNIVTSGGSGLPHQEDKWKRIIFECFIRSSLHVEDVIEEDDSMMISHGAIEYDITGPCSRCSAININGTTGSVDGRVLETAGKYRRDGYKINFGQFLQLNETSVASARSSMFIKVGSTATIE